MAKVKRKSKGDQYRRILDSLSKQLLGSSNYDDVSCGNCTELAFYDSYRVIKLLEKFHRIKKER